MEEMGKVAPSRFATLISFLSPTQIIFVITADNIVLQPLSIGSRENRKDLKSEICWLIEGQKSDCWEEQKRIFGKMLNADGDLYQTVAVSYPMNN